ncbi:MAG: LysR family transcriptional regulator [Herbaspirillum sp.]
MDIRRLKHLVALAETRNFGRAAQQCCLTQSAFSRSIMAAEEEFGLPLFDRGTVEATCTDAGDFVVEKARKLLFDARCLERDVGLYRERLIGDLTFGVGPFAAATVVAPLLTEIRSRYPGVHVRVEMSNADYLAAHLRAEQLDFYLADLRSVEDAIDLSVSKYARIAAGFYVRPGHPLLSKDSVKMAELLPYGIASVRVPETLRKAVGLLAGLDENLPLAIECDDLNLLKTIGASTDTVVACPVGFATAEFGGAQLDSLNVTGIPPLFADMAIVSLKGRSFSPMAQFAIDFLSRIQAESLTVASILQSVSTAK